MKNANQAFGLKSLSQLAVVLLFFACPLGVYAACCAGHGGVASCNKATGQKMCKDGTASATCTCPKEKPKKKKEPKAAAGKKTPKAKAEKQPKAMKKAPPPTKSIPAESKSTTEPKRSWWGGGAATTAPSATSAKGCCSNHKGVAGCDKRSGYQLCNDGSKSPTCRCQ